MLKRIFVHQSELKAGRPPCWVKFYHPRARVPHEEIVCREVHIHGDSKLVYRPDDPIEPNATLWIETEAEVALIDVTSRQRA